MFNALQNPLSLVGRLLLALLFLPAGISKIGGFAGTVGLHRLQGAADAHSRRGDCHPG